MADNPPKALVVDDEPIARRCVMWALANEGFECEPATDGCAALHKLRESHFDLVVTDLRMPNKHGYSLTMELMAMADNNPPMIVVHSIVDDIRLTKHLMAQGVSDVVHKPTDYAHFAAKMKGAILHRRSEQEIKELNQQIVDASAIAAEPPAVQQTETRGIERLSLSDFDSRLECVDRIFPVSNSSTELLRYLKESDYDIDTVTKIIEEDATLNIELLRLANISLGCQSRRKIVDIHDAIIRLGVQRIVEISLATTTLSSIVSLTSPWIDKNIARKRSVAAWFAAKQILEHRPLPALECGVLFASLVYPLRRVVTGAAFPAIYHELTQKCTETGEPLEEGERTVFPRTPAESLAKVLVRLGVPSEICSPLFLADQPRENLFTLGDVIKKPAQVVRSASILGEHAVGCWSKWETKSEMPPSTFLQDFKICDANPIIVEIRGAMSQ